MSSRNDQLPRRLLGTLGSALAGTVGFGVGFYLVFFVVLGIWGLDFDASLLPVIGGGLGSLFAGGAIALTVGRRKRLAAIGVGAGLGVLLILAVVGLDGDFGWLMIGGLALAIVTAGLVRFGMTDQLRST